MKRLMFTLISACSLQAYAQIAQSVIGFEDITLSPESYIDDSTFTYSNTDFGSSVNVTFHNFHDTTGYWYGFAASNSTDNTTAGYGNQYAAISGSGAQNSANYLIYYSGSLGISKSGNKEFFSVDINNTTLAALSMRDGDAFAKKFGGASGDDPDYLLLQIVGYQNGMQLNDTIDFYLADYRFSDNNQDYILDAWTSVNLQGIAQADSIMFFFKSSDVGQWGINTPLYFALDNVTFTSPLSLDNPSSPATLSIWPNPASGELFAETGAPARLQVIGMSGQVFIQQQSPASPARIDIQSLPAGVYILKTETGTTRTFTKFVKR